MSRNSTALVSVSTRAIDSTALFLPTTVIFFVAFASVTPAVVVPMVVSPATVSVPPKGSAAKAVVKSVYAPAVLPVPSTDAKGTAYTPSATVTV